MGRKPSRPVKTSTTLPNLKFEDCYGFCHFESLYKARSLSSLSKLLACHWRGTSRVRWTNRVKPRLQWRRGWTVLRYRLDKSTL